MTNSSPNTKQEGRVEIFSVTLPKLTKDKERRVFVYLPIGYDEQTEHYPVLYMFDGHNLFFDHTATFGKCWGLKEYLDRTKTPLIVVGVECNQEGNGRLSEYSPLSFTFHEQAIRGRGKQYMDWLVKDLKPHIDQTYRTLTDRAHTAIAGSSMGGLMSLYALATYNRYFFGCGALSPSLWVSEEVAPFLIKGKFRPDSVIYMDYGTKEFSNHSNQKRLFTDTFQLLTERNLAVTARVVAGGKHCEASWERQLPYLMQALGFTPKENT